MSCRQYVEYRNGKLTTRLDFRKEATDGKLMAVRCGNCNGCRIDGSQEWAVRCVHEAQMHDHNAFITLTYSPESLMTMCPDGSLNKKHFCLFMKRLRKHFEPKTIRFFHCGEYGEELSRPHYHALLFGIDFQDQRAWKIQNGHQMYRSPTLEKLWPFGHSLIGTVTFQSAAYVARYIMKKVNGKKAYEHYLRDHPDANIAVQLQPEYTTQSNRPGIGATWFEKFSSDVFPDDFVVMRGRKFRTPRFYEKLYGEKFPDELEKIKARRTEHALLHESDNTPARLGVRETCLDKKLDRLTRPYEEIA